MNILAEPDIKNHPGKANRPVGMVAKDIRGALFVVYSDSRPLVGPEGGSG